MTENSNTPVQFEVRKLGHVVLNVSDLEASVRFYTEVLGLRVSDRYPDSMVPGGMVFLRFNTDHHGVALVGGAPKSEHSSLNHFAFEVGTVDEVFRARAWLRRHGVPIHFEGRRRAVRCRTARVEPGRLRPQRGRGRSDGHDRGGRAARPRSRRQPRQPRRGEPRRRPARVPELHEARRLARARDPQRQREPAPAPPPPGGALPEVPTEPRFGSLSRVRAVDLASTPQTHTARRRGVAKPWAPA